MLYHWSTSGVMYGARDDETTYAIDPQTPRIVAYRDRASNCISSIEEQK